MAMQTEQIDPTFFADERDGRLRRHRHARSSAPTRAATSPAAPSSSRTCSPAEHAAPQDGALRRATTRCSSDVDVAPALAVPGVVRVLTHEDVPDNWYTILRLIGVEPNDEPVLPEDRVLYKGEPIGAVLADDASRPRSKGAAAVAGRLRGPARGVRRRGGARRRRAAIKPHGTNYFVYEGHHCRRIRFGDVEQASRRPTTSSSGATSPRRSSTRRPRRPAASSSRRATAGCRSTPTRRRCFFTLDNTALILDVPFGKLRVVGGTVGGGFGGKVDVIVEPIACIAAMPTNRPVKYVYGREEEMQVSSPRAAERIYIKDGVMDDGRDRRPQDHALRRRRRLLAPLALRHHQGGGAHAGPVHDPQRLGRRPLRLHQPHAVERHARLRRDDRRLRARERRWTGSRARSAWTRSSCGFKTPTATAT